LNRYPAWRYALIAIAIALAFLYTLPNFFGELPAVQVSSAKTTVKVDDALLGKVESALKAGGVQATGIVLDANGLRARFADTDSQLKARDLVEKSLNPDHDNPSYVVALNLLSASPNWLTAIHALPMYLGLDLRGGVHFLLQVDMQAALLKRLEAYGGEIRSLLRDKEIRHAGIAREGATLRVRFRDAATRDKAVQAIGAQVQALDLQRRDDGQDPLLVATLKPQALKLEQELAIKQNITTLNRRVNQLGVAEPVIQQQGADRIVVQLPGVQDTAKARKSSAAPRRWRCAWWTRRRCARQQLQRRRLPRAQARRHGQQRAGEKAGAGHRRPVHRRLLHLRPGPAPGGVGGAERAGGRVMRQGDAREPEEADGHHPHREGQGRGDLGGRPSRASSARASRSPGMFTPDRDQRPVAADPRRARWPRRWRSSRSAPSALRSARRTSRRASRRPSGASSVIVLFMSAYYTLFGVFSSVALGVNLLFLIALLSLLQATLTAARHRRHRAHARHGDRRQRAHQRAHPRRRCRSGQTPQAAIAAGYERAWGTILDSNVTTLIAGLALLIFGSGPVRGFAVVHCLGILTSIVSSVVVSRSIVNLAYGHRRRVAKLAIGDTSWK
jgi:preprotein translocase subunit SecD